MPTTNASDAPDDATPVTWIVHPARERPMAAALALLVILALGVVVYASFQSTAWAVFAAAALCLSLARFFFPTEYAVTPEIVEVREIWRRRRLAWSEIRRVVIGNRGAWLSPLVRPGFRDRRQGLELDFGGSPARRDWLEALAAGRGVTIERTAEAAS